MNPLIPFLVAGITGALAALALVMVLDRRVEPPDRFMAFLMFAVMVAMTWRILL